MGGLQPHQQSNGMSGQVLTDSARKSAHDDGDLFPGASVMIGGMKQQEFFNTTGDLFGGFGSDDSQFWHCSDCGNLVRTGGGCDICGRRDRRAKQKMRKKHMEATREKVGINGCASFV